MTELHVRNLPADTHERLRERAAAEGRSMSAEAAVLLRHALEQLESRQARRTAVETLRRIRETAVISEGASPAEDLVRDDRDTAH